jgi:hypothetical protein
MSEIRQSFGSWCCRLLAGIVWLAILAVPSWGQTPPAALKYRGYGRQGPVVVLDSDFFKAMEKFSNSDSNDVVYGDLQEHYLKQIATAQKLVVKANLTLIEQNEKIIRLLEDLKRQGQKESH